jgi:hypothetical protein
VPQTLSQRKPNSLLPKWWLIVLLLLGSVAVWRIFFAAPWPVLTAERLQVAQAQWQAAGDASYELEVHVQGERLERHVVRVRGGEAVEALHNERPLTEARMLDTWTVPGMFDTLAADLTFTGANSGGATGGSRPRLRLWCQFDSATGIPLRYRRLDWERGLDVSWEVVRFTPVLEKSAP